MDEKLARKYKKITGEGFILLPKNAEEMHMIDPVYRLLSRYMLVEDNLLKHCTKSVGRYQNTFYIQRKGSGRAEAIECPYKPKMMFYDQKEGLYMHVESVDVQYTQKGGAKWMVEVSKSFHVSSIEQFIQENG